MKWAVLGTWKMSFAGCKKAAILLENGSKASDAIIEAVSDVEDNPLFHSVGYSGLPDCEGKVKLDGGYMDGDTLHFGAVGSIEGFRSPVRIAYALKDYQFNNLLVGTGAEYFAESHGFDKRDNLTKASHDIYLREKDKRKQLSAYKGHDTVCVIAKDEYGTVSTGVSTSGLFMKEPGRIGDSPVPGAGFYADSFIGAAAATGVGEEIIKGALSHTAYMYMKMGLSVQEAAEKAVNELDAELTLRNGSCNSISLIAMDKEGNFGIGTNIDFPFTYACDNRRATVYLAKPINGRVCIEEVTDLNQLNID